MLVPRRAVGRRLPIVVALVIGLVGGGSSASARSHRKAELRGLPVAQLVGISRTALASLRDSSVKTAWVIHTRLQDAERVLFHNERCGGSSCPPGTSRVWVVILRGDFTYSACCTPYGAKPPRGHVYITAWLPKCCLPAGEEIEQKVPRGTRSLGRIIDLKLVFPRVPARELALSPGKGVGPVRVGDLTSNLNRRLPTIYSGDYQIGPVEVYTSHDKSGRIDQVTVSSGQVTVDGHRLNQRYSQVRRELRGWQAVDCPRSSTVTDHLLVRNGTDGYSTLLDFRERLIWAVTAIVKNGPCSWYPGAGS